MLQRLTTLIRTVSIFITADGPFEIFMSPVYLITASGGVEACADERQLPGVRITSCQRYAG